jgi:hypothetical protein
MFDGLSVDGLLDLLNLKDSRSMDRILTDRLSMDCGGTAFCAEIFGVYCSKCC